MDADEVIPGLWLGGRNAPCCVKWLADKRITHVLNCARECTRDAEILCARGIAKVEALDLDCADDPTFEIRPAMADGARFIRAALAKGGTVLVHCMAGMSRSPCVVVAFLVAQYKLTPAAALALIRKARAAVQPNIGFTAILNRWSIL